MQFDFLVIGGGIFGCYAASFLAQKGAKIALLEKESGLFRKASLVNQARLHGGYHYPRSIATAALSDEHKARFTEEHKQFVNFSYQKYYGIDRHGSFTDARQFERFCNFLKIKCEKITEHWLFNFDNLEALFLTEEYSFDPQLIADFYINKIEKQHGITLFLESEIIHTSHNSHNWSIDFLYKNNTKTIETPVIINATYSGVNGVLNQFNLPEIDLMHEISEIAFVRSPQFSDIGLTIMDGPFGSLMPWGLSGNLSLSSVAYTHHAVSFDNQPRFDCQKINQNCRPEFPSDCNFCAVRPPSSLQKMVAQMKKYFAPTVEFEPISSLFTIKTKLKSSHIDDARPTDIRLLHEKPVFWNIFAGKINSIYEVEKVI